MVRRRVERSQPTGASEIPTRLRVFVYADWHEDADDPDWFDRSRYRTEEDLGILRRVRAFARFVAARREWELETGVSISRTWTLYGHLRRESARTLAEFNEPYHPENFIQGDDPDPRWET